MPFTAALVLLGPTVTANARTHDPWAPLQRPLRLAPLAPGGNCPVTPTHALDHGRISGAAGVGPVYPLLSPFDPYSLQPGWLGAKTIWTWPTELRTKRLRVLVRGLRLDQPGELRFQLGPQWESAPLTRGLRLDTSRTVGSFSASTWGTTVTLLLVRTPGCYGLQLDSKRGTSTIVVRAGR